MIQGDSTTSGLLELIRNPKNSLTVILGAAGVMLFASIINVTASTSLSREGKTFWVSKMIPVPPRRQVYAKFLTAMGVASAGLLLSVAMLLIFLKMDIRQCALSLALAFLGTIPVTAVNMLPDIVKPKLNWTNPYEAVKQNMNVITSMLAACILTGFIVLAAILLAFLKLPEWAVYAGLAALMAALSAGALRVLAFASKRYSRLET
jgi:ABC-2 type transport system permease protein